MFGRETRMLLRHYLEQGTSKSALARQLGISRDTVHRWIREGDLDRDLDAAAVCYGPRPPVATKLDAYKPIIEARLAAYPGVVGGAPARRDPGRRVRRRLYAVEGVRAACAPDAAAGAGDPLRNARRPTGAGRFRAVSVCLGRALRPAGGARLLAAAVVSVLSAPGHGDAGEGLEEAFRYFGGVPQELLFDQMKAVITRDLRLEGGALVRNAEFLRFAHHWGFTPRACRPYRAQTKGKVERPVRYLRGNFVYGRTFLHDADLDHQRQLWLERVANVRVHGTTRERPQVRFDREERFLLQPLAGRRYTSLILDRRSASTPARPSPRPVVVVEKRSLAAYAHLAGGAA